ncbi:hypothetical protein J6590_036213 [Homalodisca vitripennis]|nr:hypothetical protein J6590_036213 [Homalodisca vitripennis]
MRREGRSGGCILGPGAVSCLVTAKDAQRGAFRWVYPGAGCRVLSCHGWHTVLFIHCVPWSTIEVVTAGLQRVQAESCNSGGCILGPGAVSCLVTVGTLFYSSTVYCEEHHRS